jgi:zinc transport system substrate-binding protein
MQMSLRRFVIAALLLSAATLSGCSAPKGANNSQPVPANGQTTSVSNQQLKVVATFLPIYLFTKAVAGDTAKVEILIRPGTEVHEYQSTPADVQTIAQADVLIKNGLGIEDFLDNTVKSAANKDLKVIDASRGVKPLGELSPVVNATQQTDHHNHDQPGANRHDHSHPVGNPHIWLDPVLAKQQVENIRDGLMAADPVNKTTYQTNAAAYIQQLAELNQSFEQGLKAYRDRTFITFHDAFPYLAKRYALKQVAVVSIPEDQLAPGDVKKTIATVQQFKVKALFSEPGIDNKLLTSLSQDLNVQVYPLDSLEAGATDPQYYFTAMKKNLQILETAFK